MANRATTFVSAICVGAMVGVPVSTLAKDMAGGADLNATDSSALIASGSTECVTTPNREASQGQRWFYRVESGTNKRCWYLRDHVERGLQTATPRSYPAQPSSNAARLLPAQPPAAPKTFSKNAQASRSLSNARAEVGARSSDVENTGITVPKTPIFITTGSASPNRGVVGPNATQGTSAALSSSESTDASISGPSAITDGLNASSSLNTGLSPASVPEMPAAANMPQEKTSASLQLLFLVILGALAIAGVLASLIHRMARIWSRRHVRLQRHSIWLRADGERHASRTVVAAASPGRNQDRRAAGAQRDDHTSGQIKRFLTQIANQARGKSKKRAPAKPQAAAAARARTPSGRRGARASAARP